MEITIAEVRLKGLSPYSPSRFYEMTKLEGETADNYEKRTWRERAHVNEKGFIILPVMGFKNGLDDAASRLSMKIPGMRNRTYKQYFESGTMVVDEIPIEPHLKKEDPEGEWLMVPPDGIRGSGKRVKKCFIRIANWAATVRFHILDPTITETVFAAHMEVFGSFIGIGRFRPARRGFYGRFAVQKIKWG